MTHVICRFCGEGFWYSKYDDKVGWVVPRGRRKRQYFHVSCLKKWIAGEDIRPNWYATDKGEFTL